ncbi:aldehyde dehydrogenase family protein [Bacillus aerolatus]|uniref:Aldehyde dehydrogenase family protein n=1 Tax=Bacillus aerolatus TaxID=2653354 RepID=A0A6I1FVU4_9BACI|nr:aldehyde dehydrogenase family protein [Bacillus aerolatus]KAB7709043.1 aldehyde dehydrogenase family protein [Bacillus aerolatus]
MKTKQELKQYQNFIGGRLTVSSSGKTMESVDPSTGKAWAQIPLSTQEDVETVVAAARHAFPSWSALSAEERSSYLRRIGDSISVHAEELTKLETRDNGDVIGVAMYLAEALKSVWYDAAGACKECGQGKTVQMGPNSVGYTLREPFGVVLGILPWNAPLFTFTIKAAYALAAGNTVIIKPSQQAAVSSLRYGELLGEILPAGVLNVISGLGREIGDALVANRGVNKVSMTGSGSTAGAILRASAQHPKPSIFELGGKSPNIVFEDADLDKAVDGVIHAIYTSNAGQRCTAGSRILIQRTIFDEMLERITERVKNTIKVGDPMDPASTMGPLSSQDQYEKILSYIELGKKEGGEIVYGGRHGGENIVPEKAELSDGYWVEPTLFKVNSNSLRICQEEIFGPVAVVIPFETEEEAVAIANDTCFGLGAGVWTKNLNLAHRMIRNIESGNVWVNTYSRVGADLPFGGFKESGYGTDSVMDYSREKACVIEIGE